MAEQNVFDYKNPQEDLLRRSDVKLQEPGMFETLGAGMESAIYNLPTYNALDKFVHRSDPEIDKESLKKKYSDVPPELFDKNMSESSAEYRVARHRTQSYYEALKEYRDPVMPWAYDLLSSGLTSTMDPLTAVEMAATEGIMVKIGFAKNLTGLNVAGKVTGTNLLAKTAAHFAENFATNTAIMTGARYPLDVYSQDYTGVKANFSDILKSSATNAAFFSPIQALTHSLMNYHAEQKILGNKDVKMWQAFTQDAGSVEKQFEDLGKGSSPHSFSQDAHEYAYNYKDGKTYNKPSGTLYGVKRGFYENTVGADPKLTHDTIVLSNSHEALKGSANYHGTSGDLFSIDANGARLINESELVKAINENPEAFPYITSKNIKTLHDLNGAELPFLQGALQKNGFDGIKSEIKSTNPSVTHAEEPYTVQMFRDSFGKYDKADIEAFNYNKQLGYNPTATEAFNAPKQLPFEQPGIRTETYSKLKQDGYLSNGKKISLDDSGYFRTDPIQYDDSFIAGYTEYFSKNQIDEINNALDKTKDYDSILKAYPDINENIKAYLDDLKVRENFEAGTMEVSEPSKEVIQKQRMVDKFKEKIKQDNPEKIAEIIKSAKYCLTTRK